MRARFVVKYEMNDIAREKTCCGEPLLPTDYHKVPEKTYDMEYDDNNMTINFGKSCVRGTTNKTVYGGGLSINKRIIARYLTDSFAGGRFIIYDDHLAELTTWGSGVPIVGSLVGEIRDI